MKLNQLNETSYRDTVLKHKLDNYTSKLNEFLEKNCSEALKAAPIYRGIQTSKDVLLLDPSKHTRKSANTSNYYTYLIDNKLDSTKNIN